MLEIFHIMLYNPPLLERGRKDLHPKAAIEESIRGVEFDYYYTGKRCGTGNQIELHVTSVINDWEDIVYIRKAWYSGNKDSWKECIANHIKIHLQDLSVDSLFIRRSMREFEVSGEKRQDWEKYKRHGISNH